MARTLSEKPHPDFLPRIQSGLMQPGETTMLGAVVAEIYFKHPSRVKLERMRQSGELHLQVHSRFLLEMFIRLKQGTHWTWYGSEDDTLSE